jgi:hypothetical protein
MEQENLIRSLDRSELGKLTIAKRACEIAWNKEHETGSWKASTLTPQMMEMNTKVGYS